MRDFVRGTIRLEGWAEAWADIFAEVEGLTGPGGDARLSQMADELWAQHAYDPGEPDRVVLFVRLRAERGGEVVHDREWVIDAQGSAYGSAMARLVSTPVALAAVAVEAGRFAPGVHAAPDDPGLVGEWLAEVGHVADHMARIDHMGDVAPATGAPSR